MRLICFLAIALCAGAADEDIAAIRNAVTALNDRMPRFGLFTADSDAPQSFQKLLEGRKVTYQVAIGSGRPQVAISHEPWGEAQIVVPGNRVVASNPRVVAGAMRFVSDDVAMVEASLVERREETRQTTPLLIVVKRDGDDWRIASLRVLAER